MEEVDQIIIPILQQIGCEFKEEQTASLAAFAAEDVVQAVGRCVNAIAAANAVEGERPRKVPSLLPKSKAARFRICTTLVQSVQELGYNNLSGFQELLYPNEKDTRKLLGWLVERLPKTDEDAEEQPLAGGKAMLGRRIRDALQDWRGQRYDQFINNGLRAGEVVGFSTTRLDWPLGNGGDSSSSSSAASAATQKVRKQYVSRFQALLARQPQRASGFAPSVLEGNGLEVAVVAEQEKDWESGDLKERKAQRQKQLNEIVRTAMGQAIKGKRDGSGKSGQDLLSEILDSYGKDEESSRMARMREFGTEQDDDQVLVDTGHGVSAVKDSGAAVVEETEEEAEKKREAELQELEQQLDGIQQQISTLRNEAESAVNNTRMLKSQLASEQDSAKKALQDYKIEDNTLKLLENAQANLAKLTQISQQSAQRLVDLGAEWEKYREPLIAKYRRKKQQLAERKDDVRTKLDQIKRMRVEMKDMAQEVREKDVISKQVLEELNRLPKSINRVVYVRRIMDIVKNLEKQKIDIRKILSDIRMVQKDINMVSEKSQRSFAVADELVFQAASRNKEQQDPAQTQTYKYLVQLRKGFDNLVQSVEKTGKLKNEVRDLTAQIAAVEARNNDMNAERLKTDLKQVKKENKGLAAQIKAAS